MFGRNRFTVACTTPSTKIFINPFGSFSIWMILATVPWMKTSSEVGSSIEALFCATRKMFFPLSSASFAALRELSLPTRTGKIMYGNNTTSRSGSTGSVFGMLSNVSIVVSLTLMGVSLIILFHFVVHP